MTNSQESPKEALIREKEKLVIAEQKAKKSRWFRALYVQKREDLFTGGFQSAFEPKGDKQ